jgi:hypothetical protein
MFPVRYELNSYILFRRNSVFKGLTKIFQFLRLCIRTTVTIDTSIRK